jgi:large subunit ribosomal protein L19
MAAGAFFLQWAIIPAQVYGGKQMNILDMLEKEQMRGDIPGFKPGDSVKVFVKIVEGQKERIQLFEGVVIRKRKGNSRSTFTVRKISYGIGVERTFPIHSPIIDRIEVASRGKVRRSKLYYLRGRKGKKAKIKDATRR